MRRRLVWIQGGASPAFTVRWVGGFGGSGGSEDTALIVLEVFIPDTTGLQSVESEDLVYGDSIAGLDPTAFDLVTITTPMGTAPHKRFRVERTIIDGLPSSSGSYEETSKWTLTSVAPHVVLRPSLVNLTEQGSAVRTSTMLNFNTGLQSNYLAFADAWFWAYSRTGESIGLFPPGELPPPESLEAVLLDPVSGTFSRFFLTAPF